VACDVCKNNGGDCDQDDDMAEVLDKMIAADVIVMATPVYFYTMDAQMKTLIDRTYARYTELNNKDIYFIVTAAVRNKNALERTIEGLEGLLSASMGQKKRALSMEPVPGILVISMGPKQ